MKLTLSLIKADVGSIGGHTKPSPQMLEVVKKEVENSIRSNLLIDGFVYNIGDDIGILMSHVHGPNNSEIHSFAWDSFLAATDIAKEQGLYGAGQDLLVDAPSGNVRGAGPGVAEIEFEHSLSDYRPAEAFMMLAADKCGPGAFNLPMYLGFADPMYCAGLMLPQMIKGFSFVIVDMNNIEGDSVLELQAPEDAYQISALLRDNERFGIEKIYSRTFGEQAAAISTQRLHNIAGKYTGKDDPVALIRTQGIFPAPEELISPYTKAHFVGGDARGSHVMPLMPVALDTPVTGIFCLPIITCLGFSVNKEGKFSENYTDFFGGVAWDQVRVHAQKKGFEMRSQGWSGSAMLPYSELEYGGFKETVTNLENCFCIREKGEEKEGRCCTWPYKKTQPYE